MNKKRAAAKLHKAGLIFMVPQGRDKYAVCRADYPNGPMWSQGFANLQEVYNFAQVVLEHGEEYALAHA